MVETSFKFVFVVCLIDICQIDLCAKNEMKMKIYTFFKSCDMGKADLQSNKCLKRVFFPTYFIAILKIKKCLQDSQYTLFTFVSYH